MEEKKYAWETKQDFLIALRAKNPKYRHLSDEAAYETYVEKYPEYQQKIREVDEPVDTSLLYGDLVKDGQSIPGKGFGSWLNETFAQGQVYKYIPYVEYAEIAEYGVLLKDIKALENGEATDRQLNRLKKFTLDQQTEKTLAYRVANGVGRSVAFAGEFATSGGAAKVAGAGAKATTAGIKKFMTKTGRKMLEKKMVQYLRKKAVVKGAEAVVKKSAGIAAQIGKKAAGTKVAQAVTGGAKKFAEKGLKDISEFTTARKLGAVAEETWKTSLAHTLRKRSVNKYGKKAILKYVTTEGGKLVLDTGRSAVVLSTVMAPRGIKGALQRMMPTMQVEDGLDDEMVLHILDEGDDIFPALMKGFADLTIENFSEMVGESFYIGANAMFRNVYTTTGLKQFFNSTKFKRGVVGALHKMDDIPQAPIKAALLRRFITKKGYGEARQVLRKFGFNGILGEMFEERVGDVMRASVGLQDNWFPTIDQLGEEYLTFAISMGLGTGGHLALNSMGLGHAAIEEYEQLHGGIQGLREKGVVVEGRRTKELGGTIKKIADLWKRQKNREGRFVKWMREFEFKGVKPFAEYQQRHSVDWVWRQVTGKSLTASIGAEVLNEGTEEQVMEAAKKILEQEFRKGIYVTTNKKRASALRRQLMNGNLQTIRHNGKVAWVAKGDALKLFTGKNAGKAMQEGTGIVVAAEQYKEMEESGLVEGTPFTAEAFNAKKGSKRYLSELDRIAKLFDLGSREDAEAYYNLFKEHYKNEKIKEADDIDNSYDPKDISIAPMFVIHDTVGNLAQAGYGSEGIGNEDEMVAYIVNGSNTDTELVLTGNANTADYGEELLESNVKEILNDENADPALRSQILGMSRLLKAIADENGIKLNDLEMLSKTILVRLMNASRHEHTTRINSIDLDEGSLETLERIARAIIGDNMYDALANAVKADQKSVDADIWEQLEGKKESEKKGEVESKETSSEAEKGPETTKESKTGSKPIVEPSEPPKPPTPTVTPAIKPKVELPPDKKIASVKQLTEEYEKGNLTKEQYISGLKEIYKAKDLDREQIIALRNIIMDVQQNGPTPQSILEFIAGNDITFSMENAGQSVMYDLNFNTDLDGILKFNQTFMDKATRTALTKIMKERHSNEEAVNLIVTSLNGQYFKDWTLASIDMEEFNDWINNQEGDFSTRAVKDAIRALLERSGIKDNIERSKAGMKLLQAEMNLYGDVVKLLHIVPGKARLIEHKDGTTTYDPGITFPNMHFTVDVIRDGVFAHLSQVLHNPMVTESWKFGAQNIKHKRYAMEMLSNMLGIKQSYLYELPDAVLQETYKQIMEVVESKTYKNMVTAKDRAMYLTRKLEDFMYSLAERTVGLQGVTSFYEDADGNFRSALRQHSQMIQVGRVVAGEMGLPVELAISVIDHAHRVLPDGRVKVLKKNTLAQDRTKIMGNVFMHQKEQGFGYYYQDLGPMGNKMQIYSFAQKIVETDEQFNEALKEYRKWHSKHTAAEKKHLVKPQYIKNYWENIWEVNSAEKMYKLHSMLNQERLRERVVGRMGSFLKGGRIDTSLRDARAAQAVTPGYKWRVRPSEKKTVHTVFVKDPEGEFDGATLFFDEIQEDNFKSNGDNAQALKINVYKVDPVTNMTRMIKTLWINPTDFKGGIYSDLLAWRERMNAKLPDGQKIEAIAFDSGVKVDGIGESQGRTEYSDIFETDADGRIIGMLDNIDPAMLRHEDIEKDDIVFVQDLIHDNEPHLSTEQKQIHTNMIFLPHRSDVLQLKAEALTMIDEVIGTIELARIGGKSFEEMDRMVGDVIGVSPGKPGDAIASFTKTIKELGNNSAWQDSINPAYHERLYNLIEQIDERNPMFAKTIQRLKAIFVQKKLSVPTSRHISLNVPSGGERLNELEIVNGKVLFPYARTNAAGLRNPHVASTRQEAIDWIKSNRVGDMMVTRNGETTDKVRTWEIKEYKEDIYGLGATGWLVPGELMISTRTPADNLHSHSFERYIGPVGGTFNAKASAQTVTLSKGADKDGDQESNTMFMRSGNTIAEKLNKAIRLQIEDVSDPAIAEAFKMETSADVLNTFVGEYGQKSEDDLPVNTPEYNERQARNGANALGALEKVAANMYATDWLTLGALKIKGISKNVLYRQANHKVDKKNVSIEITPRINQGTPYSNMFHKQAYGTILFNTSVDDAKEQKMERLGLNEITFPLIQFLLANHENFGSDAEMMSYFEGLLGYVNSRAMKIYVKIKRELESIDYEPIQYEDGKIEGKSAYIKRRLQEEKVHGRDMANILLLDKIVTELTSISQLIKVQFEAPESFSEYIRLKNVYERLMDNEMNYFDSTALKQKYSSELIRIERALNEYEKVFETSILATPEISEFMNEQQNAWMLDNTFMVDQLERDLNRAAIVKTLQVNNAKLTKNDLAQYIIRGLVFEKAKKMDEGKVNWFIESLDFIEQRGKKGTKRYDIRIIDNLIGRKLTPETLKKIRAGFDQLPSGMQDALVLYAALRHGIGESTKYGSYMVLVSDQYKVDLDRNVREMMDQIAVRSNSNAYDYLKIAKHWASNKGAKYPAKKFEDLAGVGRTMIDEIAAKNHAKNVQLIRDAKTLNDNIFKAILNAGFDAHKLFEIPEGMEGEYSPADMLVDFFGHDVLNEMPSMEMLEQQMTEFRMRTEQGTDANLEDALLEMENEAIGQIMELEKGMNAETARIMLEKSDNELFNSFLHKRYHLAMDHVEPGKKIEEQQLFQDAVVKWHFVQMMRGEIGAVQKTTLTQSKMLKRIFQDDLNSKYSGTDFSLQRINTLFNHRSPALQLMAGGKGIHKLWFENGVQINAQRKLGSWQKDFWMRMTGGLKYEKHGYKPTKETIAMSNDVLSAITSLMQGESKVVVGYNIEQKPLKEAIEIGVANEMRSKGLDTKAKQNARPPKEYADETKRLIRAGKATGDPSYRLSYKEAIRVHVEAQMRDMAVDGKVDVVAPEYHNDTAQAILDRYEESKEDWMISVDELESDIRKAFDEAMAWHNKQDNAWAPKIAYRAGYIPMFVRSTDLILKEREKGSAEEKTKSSEFMAEYRREHGSTYVSASENGLFAETTHIGQIFERYMKEMSASLMMKSSWQLMLMGEEIDGSRSIVPILADDKVMLSSSLFPPEMVGYYASRIKAKNPVYREMSDADAIRAYAMNALNDSTYELMETGIREMPQILVKKGSTKTLAKHIIGARKEGKLWQIWEHVVSWTKFMAIGFPYMSWFHAASLMESAIASRGITINNMVIHPRKEMKDFREFVNTLHEDNTIGRFWLEHGFTSINTNPDYDQGAVEQDFKKAVQIAKNHKHDGIAKSLESFLQLKRNWDHKLWVDFHAPLKIWVAQGYLEEFRDQWDEKTQGVFPEDSIARQIAEQVDSMFGGNNLERHLWATPVMRQVANSMLFAFDWTYSAAKIAGLGNLPVLNNVFGTPTGLQNNIMYRHYWPGFMAFVIYGLPMAVQGMIWGLAGMLGDDDDDMMPLPMLNEQDRVGYIDISPIAKLIEPVPVAGGLLNGKKDGRRVYIRWGKQAREVPRWFTEPIKTMGYKLSIPLKEAIEQMTGNSIGGWELPYKNAGFLGVMEAQGSFWKGRAGSAIMRFMPFTVQDIIKGRPVILFSKIKKGKHGWYATKQLSELYLAYAEKSQWKGVQAHQREIYDLGVKYLMAAEANGYDPDKINRDALQNARGELYSQLHEQLSKKNFKEAEQTALRLRMLEAKIWQIKNAFEKK